MKQRAWQISIYNVQSQTSPVSKMNCQGSADLRWVPKASVTYALPLSSAVFQELLLHAPPYQLGKVSQVQKNQFCVMQMQLQMKTPPNTSTAISEMNKPTPNYVFIMETYTRRENSMTSLHIPTMQLQPLPTQQSIVFIHNAHFLTLQYPAIVYIQL